jgi:hypothetical protein
VQHDLQSEIDRLGTRLKLINIGLVPAIVLLVALVWSLRQRRRQEPTRPAATPGGTES